MDVLEFTASIAGSLAWPVATVLLVLILRTHFGALLNELTRFRYKDMEIDFGREVQRLEDQAKTAGLHFPQRPAEPDTELEDSAQMIADASRLATEFPEPAVGLAWRAVERELSQAVMRLDIPNSKFLEYSTVSSVMALHRQGYIELETRELLERMRHLRNIAVDAGRGMSCIPSDQAREFIALAEAVTYRLRRLKR